MRRLVLSAGPMLLALAAAVPAHAGAAGTPLATAPATPLRASLDACQTALAPNTRSAVFSGSMPPLPGTWRMRMRFDLFTRPATTAKWRRISAAKWGVWHGSRPRVPGFVFTKVVDGLTAPASYRAVVQFRWLDKQSRLIRQTRRTTQTCVHPDPRADLRLSSITALPLGSGSARYTIVIRNAGLSAAEPFGVVISVGDLRVPITISAGLAAGQQRTVTIDALSCAAVGKVAVLLDPDDAVDEAGGRNVPTVRPCPL